MKQLFLHDAQKATQLVVIWPDTLFPDHTLLFGGHKPDKHTIVLMVEDYQSCSEFKSHKHRLVLQLSAMRSHAQQFKEQGCLLYYPLDQDSKTYTVYDRIKEIVHKYPTIQSIVTYDPANHGVLQQLQRLAGKLHCILRLVANQQFLTTKQEFAAFVGDKKRIMMAHFYTQQRKRLNILINAHGKPVGGTWSFDADNRQSVPIGMSIPTLARPQHTADTSDVIALVDTFFPDHPGNSQDFWLPTTRKGALAWLSRFLSERFASFGPYEDAMVIGEQFLFHSVLSPLINIGLITPQEVIDRALIYAQEHQVPLASLEGFVRQIIGWREFIKGVYDTFAQEESNFFGHTRRLKACWYAGTTGIIPLDDLIVQVQRIGYAHHIQRLMIAGSLMTLCEIAPRHMYQWFMELFVDAYEWVMVPNVYGMASFADGGLFATKPYISGSAYILKMSNYSKGPWCATWDALYWNFIAKNRDFFATQGRMAVMVRQLDRMGPEKIKQYMSTAQHFIDRVSY